VPGQSFASRDGCNTCGCGCEQSTDCPNEFDCTPDPKTMLDDCDAALMARCPYSKFNSGK
jgi:hypothetical protein